MADRPYETRTVTADIELREEDAAVGPVLSGYAATFDRSYRVGAFEERLDPSAFTRTLSLNPDVRLLVDHAGQPLARTKSGTLTLSTDALGLSVRAELDPSDPDVQRLLPKMRRGDLDQMSFAFRVPTGGDVWDYSGDVPKRSVREASLAGGDVSVVTYPANEGATVQLRARDEREAAFVLADAMLREARSGAEFDDGNRGRLREALALLGLGTNPLARLAEAAEGAAEASQRAADAVEHLAAAIPAGTPLDLAKRHAVALALRARRA